MTCLWAILLSSLAGSSSAMSCIEAVTWLGSFDTNCPKQCQEEAGGSLSVCTTGQKERSTASCDSRSCDDAVFAADDAKFTAAVAGFQTCDASDPMYGAAAMYAIYGEGYFKLHVRTIALECGVDNKITFTPPSATTCEGAIYALVLDEQKCPKQCVSDPENNDLRQCTTGEQERSTTSCAIEKCGDHIENQNDAVAAAMITGINACASHPTLSQYAGFAAMGVDGRTRQIAEIASQCGLLNKLNLAFPNPNTCSGAWVGIMANFDMYCPKQCSAEGDDETLPACVNGQEEYTAAICGTMHCGNWIYNFDDYVNARISPGLAMCACSETPSLQPVAGYAATWNKSIMDQWVSSIAYKCGVTDKLMVGSNHTRTDVPPIQSCPPPAPPPTPSLSATNTSSSTNASSTNASSTNASGSVTLATASNVVKNQPQLCLLALLLSVTGSFAVLKNGEI